jgi:hypothetical protein
MKRAKPDAASTPFGPSSFDSFQPLLLEAKLLDPEVIGSVVDVGEVLRLRALPCVAGLHRASVCCAMFGFTMSACVSVCWSVRNLVDRSVS